MEWNATFEVQRRRNCKTAETFDLLVQRTCTVSSNKDFQWFHIINTGHCFQEHLPYQVAPLMKTPFHTDYDLQILGRQRL
jgi:hypothetical protein